MDGVETAQEYGAVRCDEAVCLLGMQRQVRTDLPVLPTLWDADGAGGTYMDGVRITLILAVAVAALIVLACCKVSGDCAREEEKENAE